MNNKFNWAILTSVLLLFALSIALIFSLAPELLVSHLIYIVLGLLIFFILSRVDYQIFTRFHWPFFVFVLVLLAITFIFGSGARETVRWIKIGTYSFQPSEFAKPFLVLIFASFAAFSAWKFKELLIGLAILLLPAYLIFEQPDLSSSLVIICVWLGIAFLKADKKQVLFLTFFFLVLGSAAGLLLKDYQRERIATFLRPLEDPLGKGYHLIQATLAAGSGKFFGRGWFRGTQSHLRFLPERHTDFIFASFAEELGFVGSAALLIIYFILLNQILKIAKNSEDEFGGFICIGVFSLFFAQIVINIGMNLGLLPITGITLPLISSGGSSIVSLMACLGLVESVACRQRSNSSIQIR